MNTSIIKGLGAISAGMIIIIILSVATDALFEKLGIFPPLGKGTMTNGMMVLALAYRVVFSIAGGYITARLAPDKPMRHAIILGVIGLLLNMVGAVAMWQDAARWYPVLLTVLAVPSTWLGGKMYVKK